MVSDADDEGLDAWQLVKDVGQGRALKVVVIVCNGMTTYL